LLGAQSGRVEKRLSLAGLSAVGLVKVRGKIGGKSEACNLVVLSADRNWVDDAVGSTIRSGCAASAGGPACAELRCWSGTARGGGRRIEDSSCGCSRASTIARKSESRASSDDNRPAEQQQFAASDAATAATRPTAAARHRGRTVGAGQRHRGIEASRRGYRTCATEAHAVFHDQGWFVDGSGRCRGDCCGVVERQPQPAVETLAETVKESQHAHRSQ
jgi:hypothetical protein